MQAQTSPLGRGEKTQGYNEPMARKLTRPRPEQGARLAAYRRAAGLSQKELAELVGEPQQNISYWEQSDKPPRSDVLPRLAKVLGVSVEQLVIGKSAAGKRSGPVGKTQQVFEEVSKLPRRQQDKIVELVSALVDQYKRKKAS